MLAKKNVQALAVVCLCLGSLNVNAQAATPGQAAGAMRNAIYNDDINAVRRLMSQVELDTFDAVTPIFEKAVVNEDIASEFIRAGLNLNTTGHLAYDPHVVVRNATSCAFNFLHAAIMSNRPRLIREAMARSYDHLKDEYTGLYECDYRDSYSAYNDRHHYYDAFCGIRPLTLALKRGDVAAQAYVESLKEADRQEILDRELFFSLDNHLIDEQASWKLLALGANAKALRLMSYQDYDLNYIDQPTTTLMVAVKRSYKRSTELMKKLIELGADPHHHVFVGKPNPQYGTQPTLPTGPYSALSIALKSCDAKVARLLLAQGADGKHLVPEMLETYCFIDGKTLDLEILKFALDHGAKATLYPNPNFSSYSGNIINWIERNFGSRPLEGTHDPTIRPIFDELKIHGIQLNHVDTEKWKPGARTYTLLHALARDIVKVPVDSAARKNALIVAQILLEIGADPNVLDIYGETPLMTFRKARNDRQQKNMWFCAIDPIERILATGKEKNFVNRRTLERCGRGI